MVMLEAEDTIIINFIYERERNKIQIKCYLFNS